jgi:hypothetical protein
VDEESAEEWIVLTLTSCERGALLTRKGGECGNWEIPGEFFLCPRNSSDITTEIELLEEEGKV